MYSIQQYPHVLKVILIGIYFAAQSVAAAEPFSAECLVDSPYDLRGRDTGERINDASTSISADSVRGKQNEELIFEGNVVMRQAEREVRADRVQVLENPRRIRINGNVAANDQDLFVTAEHGSLDDASETSTFNNVNYSIGNINASGSAAQVMRVGNQAILNNATYSTCPGGDPAWQIRAEEMVLDQDTGFGTAKNARFSFMGLPLIYTPGVSFPISDQRKSGFLTPSIGQDSILGLVVGVPYYWNIAPQYDATLTPRLMTKRGIMFENEFRYVNEKHEGIFQVNYLPNDRQVSRDRYLFSVEHYSNPLENWSTSIVGSAVSDDDYIEDFGNDLGFVSTSFLAREAELRYRDLYTKFSFSAKAFQAVDPNITNANRPYQLEPRLTYQRIFPQSDRRLNVSVDAEFSRFAHPQRVEGNRLHIRPRLSYNYSNISGFIKPSLS